MVIVWGFGFVHSDDREVGKERERERERGRERERQK